MTIEDARVRAHQLNTQALLKSQEEQIRKSELDRQMEKLRNGAGLPDVFVTEFELRFVRCRDSETQQGK